MRAAGITAEPRMARAMYEPVFDDHFSSLVAEQRARVGMVARYPAVVAQGLRTACKRIPARGRVARRQVIGNELAITRMDHLVTIAVEHDGGDNLRGRRRLVRLLRCN